MATGKDKAFLQPGRLIDLDQEIGEGEKESGKGKGKGKSQPKTAAKQMSRTKGKKTIYKKKADVPIKGKPGSTQQLGNQVDRGKPAPRPGIGTSDQPKKKP